MYMNETLKDRIMKNYDEFSAGEKKIAKYIVDNYHDILAMSSGELAKKSGVSDATVVRFAKSLGYKGFLQFRNELKSEFGNIRRPYFISLSMAEKIDDEAVNDYFNAMSVDARNFMDALDLNSIERVAKRILEADTVYLFGVGSDRIVIQYLNNYFPMLGIKTVAILEEGLALREKVINMSEKDYLVMASFPNVQKDEFWVSDYAKSRGAGIFLITDSEITAKCHEIDNYVMTKSSLNAFYNSNVLPMYFCDILLMKLKELAPDRAAATLKRYEEITGL